MSRPSRLALVASVAFVATMSACANSGGGSDTSSSSGPIKIGMFATTSAGTPSAFVNTWSVDGVKAAVQAVNKDGGINGRKVEVDVCDNGGDPNRDATCARKAVSDGWLAVVGGFDPYAPAQTLPILESANIPYVGALQGTPTEYQSKVSFPVEIGTVGGYVGTFSQMADDGCKSPVFIGATDAGSDETAKQFTSAMDKAGVKGKVVPFNTGTTDVTPIVADALADKPDCIVFGGSGPDAAKVFAAVRKAGSDAALYSNPGVLQPQVLGAMGDLANGIRGASSAPLDNDPSPEMKQLVSDLTACNKDAVANEFAINGYAAVMLLKEMATGLDDVSAKNLLEKFQASKDVDVLMFPTLDFTKTRDSDLYPRMPNTSVYYSEVKDGQWVGVGGTSTATDIEDQLP